MKKKVYFIIVSILQIILVFYTIAMARNIVQTQLDAVEQNYATFPAEFQEEMKLTLENSGESMVIITSAVVLLMNVLILKEVYKNNILKKKGKLIALSAICFFVGVNEMIITLALINIIVLLFSRRKKTEDYPEKNKKEIPVVEYKKSTKKELIFGTILIFAYFGLQILIGLVLGIIQRNNKLKGNTWILADFAFNIIMLILAIVCFKDKLKEDLKLFKENAKTYIGYILPKIGIMYAIYFVVAIGCMIASGETASANQEALETLPKWYLAPIAIMWAPIVEELIFRGVLRRFIKNNGIFVIASAVIFGLLHSIGEATLANVIIIGIPYAILGGGFAYIYAKTNNLTNCILAHAFQNTIATLIMLL